MIPKITHQEIGSVTAVNGYLLKIKGLPSAKVNDIIVSREGERAKVHALYAEYIVALLLEKTTVSTGTQFYIHSAKLSISVGDHIKGKVLNALGDIILDNKKTSGSYGPTEPLLFDAKAPGVDVRSFISKQLVTGFSLIDIMVPIGKGQRELIYGPIHSGKQKFLREVIVNQKKHNTLCIYAAVGKPISFVENLKNFLKNKGVEDNTIIVSALSDEPAPMITIAPSTAFLIAEYFSKKGEDVLLVIDDMSMHANYIREVALLAGELPGKESYPGDIFYQQAHLMERAGSFKNGGSITLLPVLETNVENYTSLISTNIMASTDGHLFFTTNKEAEGYLPAVSISKSVTRIGHSTQTVLSRELSTKLRSVWAEYPKHQEYSRFGTQVSGYTKKILKQGSVLQELLNQTETDLIEFEIQILLLSIVFTDWIHNDENDLSLIKSAKKDIIKLLRTHRGFWESKNLVLKGEISFDNFLKEFSKNINLLDKICLPYKNKEQN